MRSREKSIHSFMRAGCGKTSLLKYRGIGDQGLELCQVWTVISGGDHTLPESWCVSFKVSSEMFSLEPPTELVNLPPLLPCQSGDDGYDLPDYNVTVLLLLPINGLPLVNSCSFQAFNRVDPALSSTVRVPLSPVLSTLRLVAPGHKSFLTRHFLPRDTCSRDRPGTGIYGNRTSIALQKGFAYPKTFCAKKHFFPI